MGKQTSKEIISKPRGIYGPAEGPRCRESPDEAGPPAGTSSLAGNTLAVQPDRPPRAVTGHTSSIMDADDPTARGQDSNILFLNFKSWSFYLKTINRNYLLLMK